MTQEKEKQKDGNSEKPFSGSYGFVIAPDLSTTNLAVSLAHQLTPQAEFKTDHPHITLYHAKFTDLPIAEVKDTLNALALFQGTHFTLHDLQVYGGKFLFWNLVKDEKIQTMHSQSLASARFVDRNAVSKAVEEGLTLSQKEIDNTKKYGYPLAEDLYLPHITLSYDRAGVTIPEDITAREWHITIDDVHFAEIGDYGSVRKIIALP
jgi:2'-5' RNA ligase